MTKLASFAVVAVLSLGGAALSLTSTSGTRFDPSDLRLDPMQIMQDATQLPDGRYVDLSLVLE